MAGGIGRVPGPRAPGAPGEGAATQLAPARTHLPGASMQASAALLREGIVEEASTAAWASQLLQEVVPATLGEDVQRVWRCATSRPLMTSRLVLANALHAVAAAAPPSPFSIGQTVNGAATLELLSERGSATSARWATSVEELREQYGARENWYGDLNAQEARASTTPSSPRTSRRPDAALLARRARKLAIAARKAARLYARARALLPLTLGSQLLDAVRQISEHGAFQPHGMTEEQVWRKYLPEHVECPSELSDWEAEEVYWRVLEKACTTNRHVDRMCGSVTHATAALG